MKTQAHADIDVLDRYKSDLAKGLITRFERKKAKSLAEAAAFARAYYAQEALRNAALATTALAQANIDKCNNHVAKGYKDTYVNALAHIT